MGRMRMPWAGLPALIFLLGEVVLCQPQDYSEVRIETVRVTDSIYMLRGEGGNIGVLIGSDGVFLIDDQYAPLTERIRKAVAVLSPHPIRFVLNTHWHGDHTGGNENLGEAGAILVAHDNVRKRMSKEQFQEFFERRVAPSPEVALPVVTFNRTLTFHLNGEEIHAVHVPLAHTDGDTVIHFRKSNVLHSGDLFTHGQFPFIDIPAGGSIDGMIAAAERLLAMTNADTMLIPGHGPLSDRATLERFKDMMVTVRDRIWDMMQSDRSLQEIIDSRPTRQFEAQWGLRFLKPDQWVRLFYMSLQESR